MRGRARDYALTHIAIGTRGDLFSTLGDQWSNLSRCRVERDDWRCFRPTSAGRPPEPRMLEAPRVSNAARRHLLFGGNITKRRRTRKRRHPPTDRPNTRWSIPIRQRIRTDLRRSGLRIASRRYSGRPYNTGRVPRGESTLVRSLRRREASSTSPASSQIGSLQVRSPLKFPASLLHRRLLPFSPTPGPPLRVWARSRRPLHSRFGTSPSRRPKLVILSTTSPDQRRRELITTAAGSSVSRPCMI